MLSCFTPFAASANTSAGIDRGDVVGIEKVGVDFWRSSVSSEVLEGIAEIGIRVKYYFEDI